LGPGLLRGTARGGRGGPAFRAAGASGAARRRRLLRRAAGAHRARRRRLLPRCRDRIPPVVGCARGARGGRAAHDRDRHARHEPAAVLVRQRARQARATLRAALPRRQRALHRPQPEQRSDGVLSESAVGVDLPGAHRQAPDHRRRSARRRRDLRPAPENGAGHRKIPRPAAPARVLAARLVARQRLVSMAVAKRLRRALLAALAIAGILLWFVALLLLSEAVENSDDFARIQPWLVIINTAGITVLVVLIVFNVTQLIKDHRRHVPGSRLRVRLVTLLVMVAVTPLLGVYLFSI